MRRPQRCRGQGRAALGPYGRMTPDAQKSLFFMNGVAQAAPVFSTCHPRGSLINSFRSLLRGFLYTGGQPPRADIPGPGCASYHTLCQPLARFRSAYRCGSSRPRLFCLLGCAPATFFACPSRFSLPGCLRFCHVRASSPILANSLAFTRLIRALHCCLFSTAPAASQKASLARRIFLAQCGARGSSLLPLPFAGCRHELLPTSASHPSAT